MVINRIIDNASVAVASLNRAPIVAARAQALDPRRPAPAARAPRSSASSERVSPEWAAWANGVAVRELDYHDTFLAAEYSHPGDNIPPILAVAQHVGSSGADLVRGIATGYEIQVDLVKAICLHKHKIDHVAHLGPSAAAGIGTLLGLDVETIFQAVGPGAAHHHRHPAVPQGRDLHLEGPRPGVRRQDGRRGRRPRDARPDLARRRSTRARTASSPGCWTARTPPTSVPLPERRRGQARHPGHLHQGALRRVPGAGAGSTSPASCTASTPRSPTRPTCESIVLIHTSHHTHYVIGSGANDPQKYDPHGQPRDAGPLASRTSSPSRCRTAPGTTSTPTPRSAPPAPDTVELWHKVTTAEDPEWTRRYHSTGHRREGVRRPRRDHADRRHRHRRRDRRRRRAPARRPARSPASSTCDKFRTLADGVLEPRTRSSGSSTLAAAPARARRAGELGQLTITAPTGRARPRRRPEGTVLMLYSDVRPGAEAAPRSASARRRRPPAVPRRVQPALRPADRARRASRASTSPAPCWPPTSACRTSG